MLRSPYGLRLPAYTPVLDLEPRRAAGSAMQRGRKSASVPSQRRPVRQRKQRLGAAAYTGRQCLARSTGTALFEIGIAAAVVGIIVLIGWWQDPPRGLSCLGLQVSSRPPLGCRRQIEVVGYSASPSASTSPATPLAGDNTRGRTACSHWDQRAGADPVAALLARLGETMPRGALMATMGVSQTADWRIAQLP